MIGQKIIITAAFLQPQAVYRRIRLCEILRTVSLQKSGIKR